MALSFAINPNAGETFSDAEQKRKDARMLIAAALGHTPQNVGEGLSAIGQALIARQMNQEAAAAEKNNAGINQSLLQGIFGGAGAFPAAPGAAPVAPNASPISTDVPSQRVAQAFAASGDNPPIPSSYYDAIRSAESAGNDTAKNPLSSATGRYQFTKGTWDTLMETHPELGLTPAGRTDPDQQEKAIRVFTAQNANQLASAGIPVNGGDLYAAHFLGADGAKNVLTQPDGAAVASFVGPEVIRANPFLKNMTVGQFKTWAASKGGGAPVSVASGTPAPSLPAPVNVPDMPVAAPQPVQVAQAANTGTPGTMSDADALKLLGAEPYKPGLNNMQAIAAALGSPAASPTTQRIAAALLEQQMKPNDFGFQTLPDGTVLRTDPRSGTVQPIYQGQGKAPTVQQFFDPQTGQPYEAQWNPKTQSWDKVGGVKIPANGLSVTLPDGTVIQQGGKPGADPEARQTASDVITNAAGKIRDLSKSFGSTGLLGAAESYLPNTNAAEIYRQVGVLKSNASIEALNAMRRESKTGGALGSVTEKEEAMLAAKAGALDPKSPYFQTQLDDYERTLLRIVHGKEAGDKIYEQTRGQENGGTTSNGLKWSIEP